MWALNLGRGWSRGQLEAVKRTLASGRVAIIRLGLVSHSRAPSQARWRTLCLLALVTATPSARAQPDPPKPAEETETPPPAVITPPKALGNIAVDYPAEAAGDALVLLELVVAKEGRVTSVSVVTGNQPFSDAAVEAAKTWRFTPATRGGVAVAARIRMEVRFSEPPRDGPEAEQDETVAGAPPPREPEGQPEGKPLEVVVTGERRAGGEKRISRAEVRQLPGAFGDPFRAVEVMPGVTPVASGLPYFFVRGAPPGNVGYFFDDIPVPGLYHVAAGPAVIHPAFIDEVRLYSGAYPASYGRVSGGIVTGSAAQPEGRFRGEANVRLVDSGAFVETPFAEGRGNAMLAGRYSYTGAVVSLLVPEVEIGYWDYQGRIQYRLTERDTVGVFGFGAYDFLSAEDDDGETQDIYDVTFHRYDIRYDRALGPDSALRLATTLGFDRSAAGDGELELQAQSARNRFRYVDRWSKDVLFRSGADVSVARYDILLDQDDAGGAGGGDGIPAELNPNPLPGLPPRFSPRLPDEDVTDARFASRSEVITGAWLDWVLDLGSGVTLTPGFRMDLYTADGVTRLAPEPRVAARFQVSERVALLHDLGIAHQPPSFAIPVPGLQGAAKEGLQTGVQSSAGAEVDLGDEVTGSLTLFQNVLFGLTDPLGLFQLQRADATVDNEDRATSHSYGLEVLLRRSLTKRLGGFMSYTLSRSTRASGRLEGPSSFDRRHVFNIAMAYDLGRAWRVGWRGVVYSGIPAEVAYARAARNPPRSAPFYRLDWRLEKRWRLGKTGFWALVFEVLNTTLNRETLEISCYAYGCETETIGPVTIPSIGLEASF